LYRFFIIILVLLFSGCTNSAIDKEPRKETEQKKDEQVPEKDPNSTKEEDPLPFKNERTATTMVDGVEVIINPESVITVVNKTNTLPSSYTPTDLVIPEVPFIFEEIIDKRFLRKDAADSIEKLFSAAKADNIELFAVSGFRSYERQDNIYQYEVGLIGLEEANELVALPGQSEHQLGLAMDVTSQSVKLKLTEEFGNTEEGKWLQENAHQFGFIVRYPLGKEEVTGYQYEPWHIRYVGVNVAEYLHKNDLLLEQLFLENK
jgi:D-alanyl-D-alanine carboxypeptidase